MAVWDDLVGQDRLAEQLAAAARDADALVTAEAAAEPAGTATPVDEGAEGGPASSTSKMTHAWLFTGPPGSGRAAAARAFAAALQCVSPDRALGGAPGCGFCDGCHTSLVGTHADVEVVRTDLLSIGVKETRDLVRRASLSPAGGRWQVIVLEDADRLTEGAGNVLLKAVEEPAPRTVWLLCAPSIEDVLPTIRSRCRHVTLRTPPVGAVADLLVRRDGVEPAAAQAAARATQGHIDRARRLATDERARARRAAVLRLPTRVDDLGGCLKAAQELIDAATEDAKQVAEEVDAKETEELRAALGAAAGTGGRLPRGTAGAMKELQDKQKRRSTRTQRDSLDLALVDLTGFYRDVLALQLGSSVALANDEVRDSLQRVAASSTPERTLRRIEAVIACRRALDRNVAPLLAVEAMTAALRAG
ncbi:DNA polymerase III subunit delta' [Streptomyces sp. NPDC003077]|uniref:DNA polymerase III subunit delta' n=1 Tax=Streptomyces sp. NPDC003077 TaxID=3154443 RepID=UPI0033B956AE